MKESVHSICEWAAATFGEAGSMFRIVTRANEEMAELLTAVELAPEKAPEEAADVAIILCRIAGDLMLPEHVARISPDNCPPIIRDSAMVQAVRAGGSLNKLLEEVAYGGREEVQLARLVNFTWAYLSATCRELGASLPEQMDRKMAINRARKWERDGTGHGYHRKHIEQPEGWLLYVNGEFVGNSLLFWKKGRAGYTTDIQQAHVFTREEAFRQHASREEDTPMLLSEAMAVATRQVNTELLAIHRRNQRAANQ